MIGVERRSIHLNKKLNEWRAKLDRAVTASEINEAVRMMRLYESALLGLEEN